ncbi:MAG: prepilin-type N-terminal cleavage/methylation domain-containing protein [Planctomycetes bacterium]|nr:prepilin-type N-terminal cleavage/methylation domain-containing protein [Planctomycetota bacterium]
MSGFTLIEMLIAMTISGMILVGVYGAFSASNRTVRSLDYHEQESQNLNYSCEVMQKDIRSALPAAKGESYNLWNRNEMRFKVRVGSVGEGVVHYRIKDNKLVREFKPLGKQSESLPGGIQKEQKLVVANGVTGLDFSYYSDGNWQGSMRIKQWPRAIKVVMGLGESKENKKRYSQIIRTEVN